MKELKWNGILMAVLYLALGIFLMLYPGVAGSILCYVLGGALILTGIVSIIGYFVRTARVSYWRNDLVLGLLELLLGVFVIVQYQLILSLLPFILGILVMISGFFKLQDAISARRLRMGGGWMAILGILNILFGVILLLNPFSAAKVLFVVLGVGLAFSGVTDLIAVCYLSGKIKSSDENIEIDEEDYKVL